MKIKRQQLAKVIRLHCLVCGTPFLKLRRTARPIRSNHSSIRPKHSHTCSRRCSRTFLQLENYGRIMNPL